MQDLTVGWRAKVEPRASVVAAAERWLGTSFHHAARLHGVGVDCANLLCAVYEEAGIIKHIELPHYVSDWMLHKSDERFLGHVIDDAKAREVDTPLPGDVAVFRYGRCYSHGAIVTDWPLVIHAMSALGAVVRGDATKHPLLERDGSLRAVKFYSLL